MRGNKVVNCFELSIVTKQNDSPIKTLNSWGSISSIGALWYHVHTENRRSKWQKSPISTL